SPDIDARLYPVSNSTKVWKNFSLRQPKPYLSLSAEIKVHCQALECPGFDTARFFARGDKQVLDRRQHASHMPGPFSYEGVEPLSVMMSYRLGDPIPAKLAPHVVPTALAHYGVGSPVLEQLVHGRSHRFHLEGDHPTRPPSGDVVAGLHRIADDHEES